MECLIFFPLLLCNTKPNFNFNILLFVGLLLPPRIDKDENEFSSMYINTLYCLYKSYHE